MIALALSLGAGALSENGALESWTRSFNLLAAEHGLSPLDAKDFIEVDGDQLGMEKGRLYHLYTMSDGCFLMLGMSSDGTADTCALDCPEDYPEAANLMACALAVSGNRPGYDFARSLTDEAVKGVGQNGYAAGSREGWTYMGERFSAMFNASDKNEMVLMFVYGQAQSTSEGGEGSIWDGLFPDGGDDEPAPPAPVPTPQPGKKIYKA